MVCPQESSGFIQHIYSNHISFAVSTIPGAIKIPHGHRVHRGTVIRSHRSASRWYSQQHCRPTTFVLKLHNTGVLADNSRSRFGRRRPFMIGGAIITVAATILFGFTRPVAGIFSEEGSKLVCTSSVITVRDSVLIVYSTELCQYGSPYSPSTSWTSR